MSGNNNIFYKLPEINHLSDYDKHVPQEGEDVIQRIMNNVPIHPRIGEDAFKYSHDKCGFSTESRTEKRLCRCLRNYSPENPDCKHCKVRSNEFFGKIVDPVSARIIDFEIPVSIDGKDGIGKIDILLEKEGIHYCTEVKPLWNTETILRMVAEIVTYTEILKKCNKKAFLEKYKVSIDDCKKAILYMEGSKQDEQWNSTRECSKNKNEQLRTIIKESDITVFCLKLKDGKYFIDRV